MFEQVVFRCQFLSVLVKRRPDSPDSIADFGRLLLLGSNDLAQVSRAFSSCQYFDFLQVVLKKLDRRVSTKANSSFMRLRSVQNEGGKRGSSPAAQKQTDKAMRGVLSLRVVRTTMSNVFFFFFLKKKGSKTKRGGENAL